jgi:hypothetical protein
LIEELLKDSDKILPRGPTSSDELGCEAVRAGGFSGRQSFNRVPDFVRAKGRLKLLQIMCLDKLGEVQGVFSSDCGTKEGVKVLERGLGHVGVVGKDSIVRGDAEDPVFLPPVCALAVIERCVRVSVL